MIQRISFSEGLELFKHATLEDLKEQAQKIRYHIHPQPYVTFVLDSNPNYTNLCHANCSFCAFYRHPGAKDSYLKSVKEVMQHMEFAQEAGLKTVLLQGGVIKQITLEYLISIVQAAKKDYPDIHPHFFSAVEIWNCAQNENTSSSNILQALWDAGLRTLPGGGAEIISEKVRSYISPQKMEPGAWIKVHRLAHQIGFKTTATMMYGHVEHPIDILIHLDQLRSLQDETGGFTSFIPWSYKRDRTALRRDVKNWAGKDAYLRILAFARIYLDNFKHIAASWFSEGKQIGMESLHFGADDFGGILLEENVHRATNFINKADHNSIVQMIRAAGFKPAQRDSFYHIIETYENIQEVKVPDAGRIKEADRLSILQQA